MKNVKTAPQEVEQNKNPEPIFHTCIFAIFDSLGECTEYANKQTNVLDVQMTKQQNGKWLFKATCLASA